ncbi:MAG: hypothetical protein E7350_02550 [Clostridiales bacterium]|nr:hypothetical protein [Clostridiales bacterium]
MKKLAKLGTLLFVMIAIITSLTACSIFSNQVNNNENNGDDKPAPQTQTITVYNSDTPKTYTVTLGEIAKIDIFTKPGFYFAGAYDSADGGTKYFDGDGNSTMVWGEGNPDTYYVRFESISTLMFTQTLRDEEPYKWAHGGFWTEFILNDEMKRAINGNLDTDLTVNISFDAACEQAWQLDNVYLTNMKSGGINHMCISSQAEGQLLSNGAYKTFSNTFTIKAKEFKNGEVYLYIHNSTLVGNTKYFVKNITLDIKFATE